MTLDWTQGSLAEGLRLYEAGEFLAAHEAWESQWLKSQGPEKTFLQGLIQVTAAFHHLRRNNPLGTNRLLRAALRRLEPYPACLLRNDIREQLQALNSDEPALGLAPPRIRPHRL
jgi:predicted metal-dependent hydrolase